jgi:hypothetical protein
MLSFLDILLLWILFQCVQCYTYHIDSPSFSLLCSALQVTVISKLCILGTLKFSTLDPYGMGVEMEGGKPGWNDAMNGLPGLFSVCFNQCH